MDVCVVFVVKTVVWNVSDMKDKRIQYSTKMDQRGKPQTGKKRKIPPGAWMFVLCLLYKD
jgi:hypothetical protein